MLNQQRLEKVITDMAESIGYMDMRASLEIIKEENVLEEVKHKQG